MSNLIEKKSSNSIPFNGDVAIDMDSTIQNEIEPLRRVTSPRYSHEKSSIKCCSIEWFQRRLYRLARCFMITGERRVKRDELTSEDFELPIHQKLAEYDPKLVATYWNNRNVSNPVWKLILYLFIHGIYVKLIPIIIVYMALFFVLNVYGFNDLLCEDPPNGPPIGTTTINPDMTHLALSGNRLCSKSYLQHWISIERDFTKILTFFIGFFVSMSVNNWYSQVRLVPHMDQILIQINNFVWIDPKKIIDEVKIKEDMTVKQLRNTIVRYFILSWTICLSRMSVRLNEEFTDELALNRKRLMLKEEFDILNCGTGRDSWREQWSTPLAWVAKMVNDTQQANEAKSCKIIDIKDAIGKTLGSFCQDLQKLNSYNEYRMPAPLVHILHLAIYVFLIINVAAAQDMYTEDNTANFFVKFFCDFLPWFALMKYIMLFGWLKVAADLTVPFGNGRHCIDLLGFLDFEIWKASRMLAQGLNSQKQDTATNCTSKNRAWVDFDRYWNKSD